MRKTMFQHQLHRNYPSIFHLSEFNHLQPVTN
uniref:Uncharacterized protein n=1 Tax=Anguilla anguilla TaxID=7936 RepID=A0A0E9Q5R1_ANGAN